MKHPRIEINPRVMVGKPVIRGTRVPVELILRKLAGRVSVEEILRDYPRLKAADIQAAVAYAAHALSTDETFELAEAKK